MTSTDKRHLARERMAQTRETYSTALRAVEAGFNGDYVGTCIVCMKPADTGMAFAGDAEMVIAGLTVLGLPFELAYATMREAWQERGYVLADGQGPGGYLEEPVRVCTACVRKSGANWPDPVPTVPGAVLPTIGMPRPRS